MSGEIEVGTCGFCKKTDVQLQRMYYHYGIKCECHSPDHFEIVWHCSDCTPKPPNKTTIHMKPIKEESNQPKSKGDMMDDKIRAGAAKVLEKRFFEPVSEKMMSLIRDEMNDILCNDDLLCPFINEFSIICDRSNNTRDTITMNELHLSVVRGDKRIDTRVSHDPHVVTRVYSPQSPDVVRGAHDPSNVTEEEFDNLQK